MVEEDQKQELSEDFKTVQLSFDQNKQEAAPTPDAVIDTSKQLGFNSNPESAIKEHQPDDISGDDDEVLDDVAEDADDENQLGLYLDIQHKIFKTSNRLLDDIKADLIFLIQHEHGILQERPIHYASKIAEIKYNPYEIYILNQASEVAPGVQHLTSRFNSRDKITQIRALIYSTNEPSLARTKIYHANILIKYKDSTEGIEVSNNEYHLVDELNEHDSIDLISSRLIIDSDPDEVKSSLPKIIDEANYVCSLTNKIIRIEISEPEFDHDDLHDFELGPINVRYTKALAKYPDLNQDIPPPSHCLHTLFKAIRGPLSLKLGQDHRTIPANNKSLNSHINPEILLKRLNFKLNNNEFSPPNISDTNDRKSSIIRESYIRKILEIMLLGKKAYSGTLKNPFEMEFTKSLDLVFQELRDVGSIRMHDFTKDPNFIALSAQPFYNDDLIIKCYEASVRSDSHNRPRYYDALKAISNKRSTYKLSSFISKLVSLNVIGQSEIDDAYKALSIEPSQSEQLDDDLLLTMYQNEVALHPLDGKLRNGLITIADARNSEKLHRFITYEHLPLQQAYDVLGIDSSVDDDVVSTAAIVKKVDSPIDSILVDRAVLTIATERKSFSLLDNFETEHPDLNDPIEVKDAYKYLGVDPNADDFQIITIFQMGNREIIKARAALRTIGQHKNSKLIDTFLKSGLIDHNSLPAENWPVGLNNIGNTCYLNSLLQYYFSIKPFRDTALEFNDVYKGQDIYKERRIGGRLVGEGEVDRSFQFVYQLRDLFHEQIHSDKRCITPKKELAYLAFLPSNADVEFEKSGKDYSGFSKKTESRPPSGDDQSDPIVIDSASEVEAKPDHDSDYDLIDLDEPNSQVKSAEGNEDIVMIDNEKDQYPKTAGSKMEIDGNNDEFIEDVKKNDTIEFVHESEDDDLFSSKSQEPDTKAAKISLTEMETAYEIGRQQDVTECIGNVLSQVEAALKPEGFDEGDNEQLDMVKNLFFGDSVQHLVNLTDPSNKRDKKDRFSNLFVNISDRPRNIYEAFDMVFKSEEVTIDGGPHKRSERITKLPEILQIQIQRVYYDIELQRPYKSTQALPFPETIYMDRYLDTDDKDIIQRREDVENWKTEIRDLQARKERLLTKNDQGVTYRDSLISTKEWLKSIELGKPETIKVLENQVKKIDEELMTIFQKTNEIENRIDHHFDSFQKHGYTIFAIFIHRGEANYGHYWIYIKDKKCNMFRKYNDETVSEVSNSEVFNFEEGNTATPYFLGYVRQGQEDQIEPLCRVLQAQGSSA
ncbi:Ubiquitin carboxyl-terminal hydrolase [Wickerhamomyces ciferrii]|uniref:ubiquitinyl hydrolase 1 n=1 Tax=Wickerhamomyces ciferrii (strain ATCC 14091 / BCRC 22168 / CBS 111 / JCM 3599 / NBRC 0793 / NRRL Y-1031 F-60-10) TaxID=1206466 RepID=K0KXS4_WICCF|nr:Ubiquitin carboxyl-terminal hydrolase [Wickerhamomyces ciferrii]CCH46847.1 Ubiquitin carboxyl-terminal hydrolase [Wickerhamomyces ciferrii]